MSRFPAVEDALFDASYFGRLQAAADHWWVEGMRQIGAAMLGAPRTGLEVLDAGCGTGALLPWLGRVAAPNRVHAVDFATPALQACRRFAMALDLAQASVTDLPFRSGRFDLVVSMDVLQHLTVAQETAALHETARVLRPGGRLLVRTNSAFGRGGVEEREDWRLYRPAMLRHALEAAGLHLVSLTSVNCLQGLWASAPRWRRSRAHGHGDSEHDCGQDRQAHGIGIPAAVHPLKNRVLLAFLQAEAWWLAHPGRRLPFGHSLYAVAARPA